MPRVGKYQMKKHKQPSGASKKAGKKLSAQAKKPVSKRYGKAVMKKTSPTRSVGYASTTKTSLPNYRPKKRTTSTGRKSLKN